MLLADTVAGFRAAATAAAAMTEAVMTAAAVVLTSPSSLCSSLRALILSPTKFVTYASKPKLQATSGSSRSENSSLCNSRGKTRCK